ncbi:hypothetical protein ACNQR7_30765 [Mycolicibacterium senegalense]|uniref:hypothetical protein n=1 Tax=Mycolicibacterium senegalense TaxID=1796 RepID=UPI003AAF3795
MDNIEIVEKPEELINQDILAQVPVIADPQQAQALMGALQEALQGGGRVRALFQAGAVWQRKGYDCVGDLSPLVSASRDRGESDDIILSVAVRISPRFDGEVKAFIEDQSAASRSAHLRKVEADIAQRQALIDSESQKLAALQQRADALRD